MRRAAPHEATTFAVRRDDLKRTQFLSGPPVAPTGPEPSATLRVEGFALTSNNVTYGARAAVMSSWNFFPLGDAAWGCLPAWGYATVLASDVDGLVVGDRYFGYLPMSTHFTTQPTQVTPVAFLDGAAHRPSKISVYNTYGRCATNPYYSPELEPVTMLFRPIFMTSYLLADYLSDQRYFGAERVVISSASSKTAYGTAYALSKLAERVEVTGLTSAKNRAFVEGLGLYDRVLTYDEVTALPVGDAVYVDIAGEPRVRGRLRDRLGEHLVHDAAVGGTHWEELGVTVSTDDSFRGAETQSFLAATQFAKRNAEWGAVEYQRRMAEALREFFTRALDAEKPWVHVVQANGPEAVSRAYDTVINGRALPSDGYVLML
jgi:hypothetical protein